MQINYLKNGIEINGKFLQLSDIVDNVTLTKIKEDNLVLLSFYWKETRGFNALYENIVLNEENAYRLKKIMLNKTMYFGEIAGKHSEIYGELEEHEIEINTDYEVIKQFLKAHPSGLHYNHSFTQAFINSLDSEMTDAISDDDYAFINSL